MTDNKINKEVSEFLILASSLLDQGKDEEQIVEELIDTCPSFPKGEYKKKLLLKFLQDFKRSLEENLCLDEIVIYQSEKEYLEKISDIDTRKQVLCLIIWKKMHDHPSGWIKFDREKVFKLIYTDKEFVEQEKNLKAYNNCFSNYAELRVIGSKNPIVCYSIPYMEKNKIWLTFSNDIKQLKTSLRKLFETSVFLQENKNVSD